MGGMARDHPAKQPLSPFAMTFKTSRSGQAVAALCALLALATVLASLAVFSWVLELFVHFRAQYAVAALLLAPAAWLLGRRLAACVALAAAIANLWFIVPLYAAEPAPSAHLRSLHVVSMNVFGLNRDFSRVADYVRREHPDVLVVLEVTPPWARELEGYAADFPYRWIHAGDMRSGIAILSRVAPAAARTIDLGGTGDPSPLLEFASGNERLTIVGAHLYWPLGGYSTEVRNRQLETLARLARGHDGPLVIAGDLNTTPFSPYFRRLLREGNLHECAVGTGLYGTWPSRVPFLFLEIDHCLATPGTHVDNFRKGPYVGSDHYPIAFDVPWPQGLPDPAAAPR